MNIATLVRASHSQHSHGLTPQIYFGIAAFTMYLCVVGYFIMRKYVSSH